MIIKNKKYWVYKWKQMMCYASINKCRIKGCRGCIYDRDPLVESWTHATISVSIMEDKNET